LDLQGELSLQPDENFTHLFLQPLKADEKPVLLAGGMRDYNGAEWMPDGNRIICASKKYAVHPDVEEDNDLWMIDVKTRESREFLHWSDYDLSGPSCSPDGTTILFRARPVVNRHATPVHLGVVAATGGTPSLLAQDLDRDAGITHWSADSKTIYFTAEADGFIPVWSVNTKGGKAVMVTGADAGINEFDLHGDRMVVARTVTRNPWEAVLFNIRDKSYRPLTAFNEGWVNTRTISEPKPFRITRPDGTSVQYWVMEPVGRKPGERYPVILKIHGGPSAMWGPGVFSMWHEFQTEAAWGYGIVYCNPRGSGGYGDKFKKGNFQDWGTGPAGDILGSLDDALAKNEWMDKDQLFVEGGSYAGYMVAWIIGHDNRFKAANAQRGVYELTTFMGEGNAWRLIPTHFGGYPWSPWMMRSGVLILSTYVYGEFRSSTSPIPGDQGY
ncbi:MAG: S9 family peptidase, partial [Bacteroidota bacterium]